MATKDKNRAIIKEQFSALGQIIDDAKAAKTVYFTQLAAVDALPKDFTPESLAGRKAEAASKLAAKNQALYGDTQVQLEKLSGALVELHGTLDLSDPALRTALDLIKNVGPGLGTENVLKINASFAGNQPALRLLQSAYKTAGVVDDGGLAKQIYNPGNAVKTLSQHAEAALVQGGSSPYSFGISLGVLAKLENVDFPQGDPPPSESMGPLTDAENSALKVRFKLPD